MTDSFEDEDNDGVLLLDGLSAFQKLNRKTGLHNNRHLCPPISIVCINFYRAKIILFLGDGRTLWSEEGTTQGCNLAMTMYGLGIIPMICGLDLSCTTAPPGDPGDQPEEPTSPPPHVQEPGASQPTEEEELSLHLTVSPVQEPGASQSRSQEPSSPGATPATPEPGASRPVPSLVQGWYADNGQAAGPLKTLRLLWDRVCSHGPPYGFYPKPEDSVLVVKPERFDDAVELFQGTDIQITCEGHSDLGGAIGSEAFVKAHATQRIVDWVNQIHRLADIARTQPHATYSAFVLGIQQRWVHFQRSTACDPHLFQPLEDAICEDFIPALLGLEQGEDISEILRAVFSLPVMEASPFSTLSMSAPITTVNQEDSQSHAEEHAR